ncbi:single-stranded DNA-binding protein [Demequina sp. SO4-18]|uniref:single-stranded DNA-binding protein n=1 Tax=Demequina sp. SO4-18 TaxID=3401026 RepID=UPI003B5AB3D0
MNNNTLSITGNLGADPRVNALSSGTVVGFSLGYTPRKKDGDQWVDAGPTLWFDVSVWDDMAEFYADRLHKGTRVTVTGPLGSREHDGKVYTTIRAESMSIEKPRGQSTPRPTPTSQPASNDPWGNVPAPSAEDEPRW